MASTSMCIRMNLKKAYKKFRLVLSGDVKYIHRFFYASANKLEIKISRFRWEEKTLYNLYTFYNIENELFNLFYTIIYFSTLFYKCRKPNYFSTNYYIFYTFSTKYIGLNECNTLVYNNLNLTPIL